MDEVFKKFEIWYLSKKADWEKKGIVIDGAGPGKYGHQFWIKLRCDNGLGNIALHESNGYYWVDFEGGNYDYDVMFQRSGIEFDDPMELDIYEKALIEQITRDGEDILIFNE